MNLSEMSMSQLGEMVTNAVYAKHSPSATPATVRENTKTISECRAELDRRARDARRARARRAALGY